MGAALARPLRHVAEVSRGSLPTIQARNEAAARARPTARRSSRRSSDLSVPSTVRLVRDSGLRSFWTSSVEGGKHVRSWGLLSQHTAFSTALDFGEGGEDAARHSHEQAVKSKESAAHATKRGAYRRLESNEDFPLQPAARPLSQEEKEWQRNCHAFVRRGAVDQQEIDAEDDAELQAAHEEELAELESAEQESALGEEQQQPPCKRTRHSK